MSEVKQIKENDKLLTCEDVYNLPVYWETNSIKNYLMGCYYNHFKELNIYDYNITPELEALNNKVIVKIHMHYQRDFRRFWRLASVWYIDNNEEIPFMVIQNAGREGDDYYYRIISNEEVFLKAINFLNDICHIAFKDNYPYILEEMPDKINNISTTEYNDFEEKVGYDECTIIVDSKEEVKINDYHGWPCNRIGCFYDQEYYKTRCGKYDDYYGGNILYSPEGY